MAVDQPSSSLTQAIRSVRWVVNSLNHPLASLTISLDSLDWEDAALPLVGFDPLAQFSPPAAPEQSTANDSRSARTPQPPWANATLPLSESPVGLSQTSVTRSTAAPATPVFSLRPRPADGGTRSPLDLLPNWLQLSDVSSQTEHRPFDLGQDRATEMQLEQTGLNGAGQPRDRTVISQPTPSRSHEFSPLPVSSPAVAGAIAQPTTHITTVTMIEQVVNQLLSNTSYAAATTTNFTTSSPPNLTEYSATNPAELASFQPLAIRSAATTQSTLIQSSAGRSPFDQMTESLGAGSSNQAIALSQSSAFNSGFDDANFASLNAETPVAEMAETLTLLVNDVLTEQARRHGVDLS